MREAFGKSMAEIALEWDRIAPARLEAITTGSDRTYTDTLCPIFEYEARRLGGTKALDVGCGVGYLSKILSKYVEYLDAVDVSTLSIKIAKDNFESKNINFINDDVNNIDSFDYDLCVANMFFMDCPDFERTTSSIRSKLKLNGVLLAAIPNPMIMPRYWKYEKFSWFRYLAEISVESNFKTSGTGEMEYVTTHFHRPISRYIEVFLSNRFSIEKFQEITGSVIKSDTLKKYPRHLFFFLRAI